MDGSGEDGSRACGMGETGHCAAGGGGGNTRWTREGRQGRLWVRADGKQAAAMGTTTMNFFFSSLSRASDLIGLGFLALPF